MCVQVQVDTLSPAWCETLLFNRVLLEGTKEELQQDPPLIIISIYDYDSMVTPAFFLPVSQNTSVFTFKPLDWDSLRVVLRRNQPSNAPPKDADPELRLSSCYQLMSAGPARVSPLSWAVWYGNTTWTRHMLKSSKSGNVFRQLLELTKLLENSPYNPSHSASVSIYVCVQGGVKLLGRAFAEPEFKIVEQHYKKPPLRFYDINLGRAAAGELLAAFELIELDYSGFGEVTLLILVVFKNFWQFCPSFITITLSIAEMGI